jgi:hypothetical protein
MTPEIETAAGYMARISASLHESYGDDCVVHACTLAELLHGEGRDAWIARIRETKRQGDTSYHGPLIARRFRDADARVWTTHYVACSADVAYDPLAGQPLPIASYTAVVFGKELPIETYLDGQTTAELLRTNALRQRFRDDRGGVTTR